MNGGDTSGCPPGGDDAGSWIRRGMACTRRGRYQKALESFDRALEVEPGSVEGLLSRGNALYALGRYADSLAAYDRALEIAPERPGLHIARSNALSALGRKDEAAAAFARALDMRRGPKTG